MDTSKGLLLKKLVLHGHRKDYEVPFQPGVNIIHGDADTGKSSILRLINYHLGSKSIKLDEEISSSVKHSTLEISIHGDDYCISRDLYNASRDIEVYSCSLGEISENFPKKYKATVPKTANDEKSLSDFLIEELGLPVVKLKQAPTKNDSPTSRLSFRDLLKYMYLDQNDVGNSQILDLGNPVVAVKNKEVFKYIFNVLDSSISELNIAISEKSAEKNKLLSSYKSVSEFLSDTQLDSRNELEIEFDNIDELKQELENRLSEVDTRITSDSESYEAMKGALDVINLNINQQEDVKQSSIRNIERFSRLLNDYQNDIEIIKSSIDSKQVLGKDIPTTSNCPICDNLIEITDIEEKFDLHADQPLKNELTAIRRRSKDLTQLIESNRQSLGESIENLRLLSEERSKAVQMLDVELQESISPYLAERDSTIRELSKINERKNNLATSLKVRKKQESILEQVGRLEAAIEKLKIKLDELQKNSPSLQKTLDFLSADFRNFVKKINIKNQRDIKIDEKTFLPVVRDTEYRNLNSGGLRTIASIGYFASILKQKHRTDTNLPGLLMIDTVGKFVGKTSSDQSTAENSPEESEGVADPEKYSNLYSALIDLATQFDENNNLCQIILVDNDIPPKIAEHNRGFEIAHYSSNGKDGLPIGLIDDWEATETHKPIELS